jgi:hypothetical protein
MEVCVPRVTADYRPSEPTGWPNLSATLGGHVTAVEFVVDGRPWRVALLASDVPQGDPYYQGRPSEAFTAVLEQTFGDHYDFRYQHGSPGLTARSYSVFVTQDATGTRFGADLHLVYEPDRHPGLNVAEGSDRHDPPADDATHWIQVVRQADAVANLDHDGRANPFYPYGGRTSVDGHLLVNYQGCLQTACCSAPLRVCAETFLARDTGRLDAAGRGIVEIYGGVVWGWEAGPTTGSPSR